MDWNDTLGIARGLQENPDFNDLDITGLTPQNLENLIIENGYADAPLPSSELRDNILNSVLWHWMRLRGDQDNQMQEAG